MYVLSLSVFLFLSHSFSLFLIVSLISSGLFVFSLRFKCGSIQWVMKWQDSAFEPSFKHLSARRLIPPKITPSDLLNCTFTTHQHTHTPDSLWRLWWEGSHRVLLKGSELSPKKLLVQLISSQSPSPRRWHFQSNVSETHKTVQGYSHWGYPVLETKLKRLQYVSENGLQPKSCVTWCQSTQTHTLGWMLRGTAKGPWRLTAQSLWQQLGIFLSIHQGWGLVVVVVDVKLYWP